MKESRLKMIAFTLALISMLTGCTKDKDLSGPEIAYSFFVAGHTYGSPTGSNFGVHPPLRKKFNFINRSSLDFGVFTGDIVRKATVQSWDSIDAELKLLNMPVYFAAGNHDVNDRMLFEQRYGPTYSRFIFNSDLHIILDPNLDEWNISGDQLDFLQSTVDSHAVAVKNVYVYFHQVLWWENENTFYKIKMNSTEGRADTINFWSEVEPLFHQLTNQVYMFAGDVGATATGGEVFYHNYDNITFVASGMGGYQRDNFIIVDVYEDGSTKFRLIALNTDLINGMGRLEEHGLK